jgi:hypothetical protein
MRTSRSVASVTLTLCCSLAMASCGGSDDQYANDPSQQQQGYPPQQQGYPPQQQGYPPQQQGYPQQGAPPPATAPAQTGTAPAPLIGIPCQADSGCGMNKCNLTTQTCAPCATKADCTSGGCALGICVPGGTQ